MDQVSETFYFLIFSKQVEVTLTLYLGFVIGERSGFVQIYDRFQVFLKVFLHFQSFFSFFLFPKVVS